MYFCIFTIKDNPVTFEIKYNKPWAGLWRETPLFRSPEQLSELRQFFIEHHTKDKVLQSLATGFRSRFEYRPPVPWGHVNNYQPLCTGEGIRFFREKMREQVLQGRMIGGPG